MKTWQMYVEGKWIHAEGARTYSLPNPASEEEIALAPNASVADVGRAVAASSGGRTSSEMCSSPPTAPSS